MNELFEYRSKYGTYKNCFFNISRYSTNNSPRIDIYSNDEGPICTVTVNLDGLKLEDGYVAIKNYSENEGIEKELKRLNVIVDQPFKSIVQGYVMVPIYRLTEEFTEIYL